MSKRTKIFLGVFAAFIVIAGLVVVKSSTQSEPATDEAEWVESKDSVILAPNNEKDRQPHENGEVRLDFRKKQQLTKGIGYSTINAKFGFRKELIIEEPTVFTQCMPVDFYMEDIRFGIYRDKAMTDPVEEADPGYNFRAYSDIEEGAEYEDYPEYRTHIQVILEPGTYYAAVYTTKESEEGVFLYISWYDVLEDDLTLEAGKYQYFYPVPGEEYEFPFTVDDNTEIVLETAGIAGTLTLYDTDGKTAMKTLEIDDDQPYKESKKHFTFEKGGTYYFRLTDYPEEVFKELNYGWGEPRARCLQYELVK